MKRAAFVLLVVLGVVSSAGTADALWTSSGTGAGTAAALTMPAGNTPSVVASGDEVTVSWAASTVAAGLDADSYAVMRFDGSGTAQTVAGGCAGTVTALTCVEEPVPSGSWTYAVVPRLGSWTGAASPPSPAVAVSAASLSLAPSTISSALPATLNGTISGFTAGQTLTFRLDDPATGTVLASTSTPAQVPADGSAAITATIPAGTGNGIHTVFALGSAGDVASASITVAAPLTHTASTSAWRLTDASSGIASDQTDHFSVAGDGRSRGPIAAGYGWQPTFHATRYVDVDYYGGLPTGLALTDAELTSPSPAARAPRRASTPRSVASPRPPCSAAAGPQPRPWDARPVPLPSRSRWPSPRSRPRTWPMTCAFASSRRTPPAPSPPPERTRSTWRRSPRAPRAHRSRCTGSVTPTPPARRSGATGHWRRPGTARSTGPGPGASTFAMTRTLSMAFPSRVPAAASGIGATFTHAYASDEPGSQTCYVLEILAGATSLGSRGTAAAPICTTSGAFVTDTFALPEVDTVAEANSLSVRLYVRSDATGWRSPASRHDLATLTLTYTADSPVLPAAPTSLSATASAPRQVDLTWADNATNETSYTVERAPDGAGTWATVATLGASTTSYADTSVSGGAGYRYRVRVHNSGGSTASSTVTVATPMPPLPAAPTGLSATGVTATRIDLAWTDNATTESGVLVERSPGGADTWTAIATTAIDATTYSDTGVTAGGTFDYRVRAVNESGQSAASEVATATTATCVAPGTQSVVADADTTVMQDLMLPEGDNMGIGSLTTLYTQSQAPNMNWRTLLHFALPEAPAGCTLLEASLELPTVLQAAPGRTLEVYQAATAWGELTATWGNQPGTVGTAATASFAVGVRTWAVTDQTAALYAGANTGFVLCDGAEGAATQVVQEFSSREAAANRPRLVLTFG